MGSESRHGRWRTLLAFIVAALWIRALFRRRARRAELTEGGAPVRRISRFGRALDPYRDVPSEGFVMPPLPPAEIVAIPGRGEMFVRHSRRPGADGLPVVLLHGWIATADLNWFLVFDALGSEHRILAPDLRGHGRGPRSPGTFTLEDCADDVAAMLRGMGIERAVAVGYSMGGPVAMLLARRHPDLVAGLVLEATAMEFSATRAERAQWRVMGLVSLLLRWPTGRIALLRAMGGTDDLPRELLVHREWAEAEFRRNDPMEMAEAGRALAAFDARPFASTLGVPVAVVLTTGDRLVPPARQRALAEATRAAVFEIEADHTAIAERPAELADITLRAIAAVVAQAGPPASGAIYPPGQVPGSVS